MHNLIYLIGRITKGVESRTLEDGKELKTIQIAVQRPFKNEDGIYETDFIEVTLFGYLVNQTEEYCKKGSLIGIKGRLQTTKTDDGKYLMSVVADKLTFLSSED